MDHDFLSKLKNKINHIQVDALTMNQESLAEKLPDERDIGRIFDGDKLKAFRYPLRILHQQQKQRCYKVGHKGNQET